MVRRTRPRPAGPLEVDPATLGGVGRRCGTAWLTCYPGGGFASVGVLAFVQVDREPARVNATAVASRT
ncbi:hypothetical protein [Nocardia rhizosphaerae]|uniref:Uncharacterized protein n=1 Tax=Nocardia rhizosphaerae TaxID=1691571 RepID=A0ABV8L590_9NOCA